MARNHDRHQAAKKCAESLVTCDICADIYKQPKVLPCQHTFCFLCLQRFYDSCNQSRILKISTFPCPSCRKTIHLPPGGIDEFPNDFRISQICEVLENLTRKDDTAEDTQRGDFKPCGICQAEDSPASHFCLQCGRYLCEKCGNRHTNIPMFREHYTVAIPESQDLSGIFCKDHQDVIKYYCSDCESGSCVICALSTHGKHSLMDISEALVHQRHLIQNGAEKLEEKLESLEKQAQHLVTMQRQQTAKFERERNLILNHARLATENIEKQRDELLLELKAKDDSFTKDITEKQQRLEGMVSRVSQLCDRARQSADLNQPISLLNGYAEIKSELNDMLEVADNGWNEVPELELRVPKFAELTLREAVESQRSEEEEEVMVEVHMASETEEVNESGIDTLNATGIDQPDAAAAQEETVIEAESRPEVISALPHNVKTEINAKMESDTDEDEVFQDTASCLSSENLLTSRFEVQLVCPQALQGLSAELQWENPDFQHARDAAIFTDQRIAAMDHTYDGKRVQIYDANGNPSGGPICDYIIKPWACMVNHSSGHLIVTDHGDSAVKVIDDNNLLQHSWKRMFNKPCGISVMRGGEYVVTDSGSRNHKVSILLPSGMRVKNFASKGAGSGCLLSPNYVAVDQNDRLVISDCENNAVRIFDRLGKQLLGFSWKSANGQLMCPQGVAITSNNHILVADHTYKGVSLFSPDGRFIQHIVNTGCLPWGVDTKGDTLAVATEQGLKVYTLKSG